jgi:hypothetical protein
MSRKIIIIGGLDEKSDRKNVIEQLTERTANDNIQWQWVYADEASNFEPPAKYLGSVFEALRSARRQINQSSTDASVTVIKLFRLHGRTQSKLYEIWPDPVSAPPVANANELIDWIFSAEANIVPREDWLVTCREAALLALFSKLIRNKSWNKNIHGHHWTKEADLLGQAPVSRSDYPEIGAEACKLTEKLRGTLLLTKGSNQGNTPKEWSINLAHLTAVKKCLLDKDLSILAGVPGMASLIASIAVGDRSLSSQEIISERVLGICRATH